MAGNDRYFLIFDSQSCLTDFRHRLNCERVFGEFQEKIPKLKLPKTGKILVSDEEGLKMAQVFQMGMGKFLPVSISPPQKPKMRKMIFNFMNEVEVEMRKSCFLVLICHETKKVISELHLRPPAELEPEQFLLYKLGVKKILHVSPTLIKD